jgi:excisionase family DNA binding protein
MTQPSKYVTTQDVANYFGIAESTVNAQVKSGDIPPGCYVRIGRVYRFDLEKIEQTLLDRTGKTEHGDQLELDLDNPNEN